jgi:hypothetical protein
VDAQGAASQRRCNPIRNAEIRFGFAAGQWHPIKIQEDYVGCYREAVFVGADGKVYVHPAEVRDIQAFARIWVRNLKHQGSASAAKGQASR